MIVAHSVLPRWEAWCAAVELVAWIMARQRACRRNELPLRALDLSLTPSDDVVQKHAYTHGIYPTCYSRYQCLPPSVHRTRRSLASSTRSPHLAIIHDLDRTSCNPRIFRHLFANAMHTVD